MLFTIYCIINYLRGKMCKHNNEVDKHNNEVNKHNNEVDNHNNEVDKKYVNQSRIFVPPMYYNLYVCKYERLKCNIEYLIINNKFVGSKHKQNAICFLNKVYKEYPYNNCVVGYIPSPSLIHKNIIQNIIGNNGYFFNKTMNNCNIDFIWHDHKTNMFYFWGRERENVTKAMNSIRWRIQKCYTLCNNIK